MLDGGTRLLGRVLPIGRGWRLTIVLLAVVGLATRARDALARPLVNRGVEGGTGVVMLGFAGALAAEG